MLDERLKSDFWLEIVAQLERRRVPHAAERVAEYRRNLLEREVGDMIYHQDPEDVVRALASDVPR